MSEGRARQKWRRVAWLLGIAVAAAIALTWTLATRRIELSDDQMQSRAIILREVPLGTAMAEARARLRARGFRCLEVENQSFAEYANGRRFDYTWCDIRDSGWLVYRRWQVALVPSQGKLQDVFVGPGYLTGP